MDFVADETQRMVADTLARLLRVDNDFAVRRQRLAASPPQRLALWPALASSGIIGTGFADDVGGFGGSPRDIAIVQYQLGRSLAVEPYLAVVLSGIILRAAAPHRRGSEIERMVVGNRIIVVAHSEEGDPFAPPRVTALEDGGAYRLAGAKRVVRHADVADAFLVSASLADATLGWFLIEARGDGVSVDTYRLMDGSGAGTLEFRDANGTLISTGADAERALLDCLDWGIVALAAEATGILEALNETTREYLRTRVQFGVAIGSFQALQHRSADMFIAAEEAGIATDAVLTAFADGPPGAGRSSRVSALKSIIDQAGLMVGHEAVQMHGGVGVSDELIVSHYLRRLATMRAELGGRDLHRERFRALTA